MSLQAFQRALVDLTLSPQISGRLREGDVSILDSYDLDESERERLVNVVRQPGMPVNCTVARGNRFDAIGEVFPMTLVLLEPKLRELLSELWEKHPPSNYQFAGEENAFADFVREKLSTNQYSISYLEEIFNYECLCWQLAQEMRNQRRRDHEAHAIVEFTHPPDLLLEPLSRLVTPPEDLPTGSYRARLILRGTRFFVEMLTEKQNEPQISQMHTDRN